MPCPFGTEEGQDQEEEAEAVPYTGLAAVSASMVVEIGVSEAAGIKVRVGQQKPVSVPVKQSQAGYTELFEGGANADALGRSEEAVAGSARSIGIAEVVTAVGGAVYLQSLFDLTKNRSRLRSGAAKAAVGGLMKSGYKGGGAGYHLQSVFDPRKAVKVR